MPVFADDGVGEADVREAGLGKRLGLAHRRRREPLGSQGALTSGDGDGLVRLDVGAERDALGRRLGLHPLQVRLQPLFLNEEAGRGEVV